MPVPQPIPAPVEQKPEIPAQSEKPVEAQKPEETKKPEEPITVPPPEIKPLDQALVAPLVTEAKKEQPAPEIKPAENQAPESKTPEVQTPEVKATEEKKVEQKEAEQKGTEQKTIEPSVEKPVQKEEKQVSENVEDLENDKDLHKSEEEDNVIQEEQPEEKAAPKGRFGLLEKLLSFVAQDKEANPVLAGYFCKVMMVIIEKRKIDLLDYIFTYREHIYNILKHGYNKSVADVLSKILSNEDKFITGATGEEYEIEKREVLDKMISKMEPTNTVEDITNNCFILCNLVDNKQHLSYFLNPDVIKRIYQIGVSGHPMSLRACLTFFMTMIRTKLSASSQQNPADTFGFNTIPSILFKSNFYRRNKERRRNGFIKCN